MKEVSVFIASSVREFEKERLLISPYLEMLNGVYKRLDVQVKWNRPETQFGALTMGGSQTTLDEYVRECDLFVLIVGKRVGVYTEHEFEIALERFRWTGGKAPIILPCFLKDKLTPDSAAFLKRMRTLGGEQYIDPYDNFDAVLTRLQMTLTNYVVSVMDMGDEEADLNRARERVIGRIHALRYEAERLEAAPPSPETIPELSTTYAELARLVRDYKVEPDTLIDCMEFFWKQNQHKEGIDVGLWLEGFYTMNPPSKAIWARLKYRMAVCHHASNNYKQAKQYYQDALKTYEELDKDVLSTYEQNIALIFGNLGLLLEGKNSMDEEGTNIVPTELKRKLPYDEEKPYIFASYSHKDGKKVLELLQSMANEGYRIWYDEGISASEDWRKVIANHLSDCAIFMLCVSTSSVKSKPCSRELFYAVDNDKPIFPIYLEETTLPKDWAMYLPSYQSKKLFQYDAMSRFMEYLNQDMTLSQCRDIPNGNPEPYYQNALNIWQKLVLDSKNPFTPEMAYIYNNIGILLQCTNHVEDSVRYYRDALEERYYQKALEILRYLLPSNRITYEPDIAKICNNLGNLLWHSKGRMEDAERYYREALDIRIHMAKANPDAYKPDVAKTFNSLGKLLSDMDRMEEAEACLREALEIRRLLASKSPTTFEPYVAATCYDLGLFEIHRAKLDAAKLYFEEALSVYERFPHLAKKAQDCRDRLAELQA